MNTLIHKKREKYASSSVWQKFHEIYTHDTGVLVKFFFFCTFCKEVVFNSGGGGNTNTLLRHKCHNADQQTGIKTNPTRICVSAEVKESFKSAGANLVSLDLRPYTILSGQGMIDFCQACMEFGQKYKKATKEDLINILPCAKTLQRRVCKRATENIERMSALMKQAVEFGGISATTDTWTDDHCHITYISVILHLCIYLNDQIQFYRLTLGTVEVPEMIKTGMKISLQNLNIKI